MNDPEQIELLRQLAEQASSGPWGVRYFEDDNAGEARRFARALELSEEHHPATGKVSWRLIQGGPEACTADPEQNDGDWLNLAFFGNGPCSEVNAIYVANLHPGVVLELLDAAAERDALAAQVAEWEKVREIIRLRIADYRLAELHEDPANDCGSCISVETGRSCGMVYRGNGDVQDCPDCGGSGVAPVLPVEPPEGPEEKVVDLMDALFQSVEKAKADRRAAPPIEDTGGEQ